MTSAKGDERRNMTVAHWGSYCVDTQANPVTIADNPDDPVPSVIGSGWLSARNDKDSRIQRPAVRKGWLEGDGGANRNDDSFVEMSWDEIIALTGNELSRVISKHGNEAIYGGSYGWGSAGRFHHSQSQMRRFLNLIGGYVAAKNTYSHAAAEVIFPYIAGMSNKEVEEGLTSWQLIADNCELLLAVGGISGRTAQIASGGTWAHDMEGWLEKAARNGMQTVSLSPLKSDIHNIDNAEWQPIRPGTDTAYLLALCYELISQSLHDKNFLQQYTHGFETFKSYVLGNSDGQPKSPEWAATLCDIAAKDIREMATRLSKKRVMISIAWGLQRADHGEQTVWAGLALACLLGQISQPGLGFGFGYGSTTPPGRSKRFISWPSVSQGQNPVTDFIPVARVADMLLHPGETYSYNGETRNYPDIKLVYWCGGNPFHHHQDLNRLEQAWTRPETVIVQDHSWTATAKRADIVLPATMPLERNDIFLNRRDPNLVAMRQVSPPMGEALNDFDIFTLLSRHMEIEQAFTEGRSDSEWMSHLWDQCRQVAKDNGFILPSYQEFQERGHAEVPENNQTRILFSDFIADPLTNPLATDSGKINLSCENIAKMQLADCPPHPSWLEPIEWLGQDKPCALHLISNQPRTRLHSQLDNGETSRASKISGREVCTMHPTQAAARGLQERDIVKLYNERGACLAAVALDDNMHSDCIVLPTGAWLDMQDTQAGRIDVHGNPNMLTIDKGASKLTQGNISHTALVWVEKWDAPLPEIRAFSPPKFEQRRT